MAIKPGSGPEVTVAVVSWNTRKLLSECLTSLAADARQGLADVWVLDNASTDGSVDLVRAEFPWVHVIASPTNLGFGAGVNAVAQRTDTTWLVPANADTAIVPGALEALVDAGRQHPEAGVLAPRLILPDGTSQHSVFPFPTVPFTAAYVLGVTHISRTLARYWCIDSGFDPDEEREVPWAVGAFLLVRRTAWDEVGGFDSQQWMYAEDLDLGWRLDRAGWKTRYVPGARVRHHESAATDQAWGSERHRRWHASTYAWLLRRHGPWYARVIAAVNVAGFLAQAAVMSALAATGARRATERRRRAVGSARAHAVGFRPRSFLEDVR